MKLRDYDNLNKGKNTAIAASLSIAAIVLVVIFVLIFNYDKIKKEYNRSSAKDKLASLEEVFSTSTEDAYVPYQSEEHLTVADLDFYDMYKTEESEEESTGALTEEKDKEIEKDNSKTDEIKIDESNDGKHTLIKYADGSSEWVSISPNLPKAEYDLTNLYSQSGKMKYFEDNKCVSTFGVDISKDEDYVDFVKLKKAGAEFVMLRVGQRGYQTGTISLDDYFTDNLKRATDAGLNVGLYFLSSAISTDEAKEEAKFVIDSVGDKKISYPIVFRMQTGNGDATRMDSLSKNDRSMIARAFLNDIKASGYIPMIYADKEWFIKKVDLSKLISDFDIWYTEVDEDLPSFPYKYSMWQYESEGYIDGIAGPVMFDVCFLDYSLK